MDDHRALVFIVSQIHLLRAHRALHGRQGRVLIVEIQRGIQRCETLHGSRYLVVASATSDFELIVPMLIEIVLGVQGFLGFVPFSFSTLQMIFEVGLPERHKFISVNSFLMILLSI